MKPIPILAVIVLLSSGMICPAQSPTSQAVQATLPAATPYAVTTQDANSRVWQRTTYDNGPGGMVTNTHSYTELASGLNHKVNGQWMASSEYIEILPNGTAVATNGQHQAYFPGDIYNGQIQLVTPDGLQLNSRPMALVYFDGTNTEVIAELTNSTGVVVGNNQVVYPSAFTGFEVDLRYTYTKAGFEQDIILRQQPPTPESLGLNPGTARLQVLTEFFSPPQPTIQSTTLPAQAGISLVDQNLGFGSMQMVPGKAFLMGTNATDAGAMVSKSWLTVEGRKILMEEVPVDAILAGLAALPMTAMNSNSGKHSHTASRQLKLPPKRLAVNQTSKTMLLAKADLPAEGFLLDYQTINSSLTNYTFRGDTTYYISGLVNLYGTSTFEGGAVIKYTNRAALQIAVTTTPVWNSAPYRPIIFTAKDDNSVGDAISGSTGTPTGYYASSALNFTTANHNNYPTFSNFRIAYASNGISSASSSGSGNPTIRDGQFVNCQYACGFAGSFCYVYNALFANVGTNFTFLNVGSLDMANVTFANVGTIIAPGAVAPSDAYTVENCVFATVTSLGGYTSGTPPTGNNNGFYSAPTFGTGTTTSVNPFQSSGAGYYYLSTGCGFQNAGTTSIDSTLLADIKTKTTYPPILYSNVTVAVNTTLSPQAQRDIDTPDLGYHYDPIDYLVDQFTLTNALLTLTNGVAIACYNDTGITLEDGSSISSIGSPLYPNWIVRYSSAQEEPISLLGLGSGPNSGLPLNPYHQTVAPNGQFRFTKFACPAGGGDHLYHYQNNWSYANLLVQDCEFWGGTNVCGGNTNTVATLKNNLFWRSSFSAIPMYSTAISYLYLTNNLFWGASSVTLGATTKAAGSTNWCVFNNDFDSCTNIGNLTVSITNGYNAYFNSSGYVYPTNTTDIFSTNALAFQTGPLGTFYQTNTSPLIDAGSTTADQVGLYHYTTQVSQATEGTSQVDIGYHYVAVDGNGNPLDWDGDGIPDYVEDANGNGLVDSGETDWQSASDRGLKIWITRPRNGATPP